MRLALVALVLCPTITLAQTVRDSTISVSATKITRITPDRASMYVLVRVDQIASVAAAALAAGASGVSAITFESTVADSVRRSKLAEALAIARADAQALATALDGKLGGFVDVSSSASPNLGFAGPTTLAFDARFMQPTQVPEVTISTSVNVRYRLVR